MKIIRYRFCTPICEEGKIRETFCDVEMPWSEQGEEIAKQEAYRGEYTVIEQEEGAV